MVGFTTGGDVKVEFGLAGIVEGDKVCQDRLHNHFWQHGAFSEWLFFTFNVREQQRFPGLCLDDH